MKINSKLLPILNSYSEYDDEIYSCEYVNGLSRATLINSRPYSSVGWTTEGTYSNKAKFLFVLLFGGQYGTKSALVPISVFNTFTTTDPYLFKDGSTSLYQFAYDDGAIKGYFRSSATDYSVSIYEIN